VLTLQLLRPLRVKNTNLENDVIRGVTAHFTSLLDPDEAGIEKCKGMAMNSVPEPYLDAWARLQCQKPVPVPETQWRQAIDDAGRFSNGAATPSSFVGPLPICSMPQHMAYEHLEKYPPMV
jgi:hypothetical protein